MKQIDPEELRRVFNYDPETGILTWKVLTGRRANVGDIAGCAANGERRITVGIHGQLHRTHRIIWAMMTGAWPIHQIDHINENPLDNRWCNLREATKSQNMMNIRTRKNNTSGHKGVYFHKPTQTWSVRVRVNNKVHSFKYYRNKEDAIRVAQAAYVKLHGEFAKF